MANVLCLPCLEPYVVVHVPNRRALFQTPDEGLGWWCQKCGRVDTTTDYRSGMYHRLCGARLDVETGRAPSCSKCTSWPVSPYAVITFSELVTQSVCQPVKAEAEEMIPMSRTNDALVNTTFETRKAVTRGIQAAAALAAIDVFLAQLRKSLGASWPAILDTDAGAAALRALAPSMMLFACNYLSNENPVAARARPYAEAAVEGVAFAHGQALAVLIVPWVQQFVDAAAGRPNEAKSGGDQ